MRFLFLLTLLLSFRSAAAPAAPTQLAAAILSTSSIQLSWQDNSTDEVRFLIGQRILPASTFTVLGSAPANSTVGFVTELQAANAYEYVVVAEDSEGVRSFSNLANVAFNPVLIAPPPGDLELTSDVISPVIHLAGLFEDSDVAIAARLTTDVGNLDFAFYDGAAPQTVANFLTYLTRGDFLNTIIHRSVPGFVIQGGGFRADATASPIAKDPPVPNEYLISNVRGTVAMAKLADAPNSATNEYFINLADNSKPPNDLNGQNGGFTVFARIAGNGMLVADAIAALPRQNYSAVRGALSATPVRNGAVAFDPQSLVRVLAAGTIDPIALSVSSSDEAIAQPVMNGNDLVLSPRAPGMATVTVTATDLDGLTASTSFQVTVTPDTYEKWVARQSFASPEDALATADPDHDGRVNLVEFAQGTSPLSSSGSGLVASIHENRPSVIFPLRPHLAGTDVELESAPSPEGPWTTRWSPDEGLGHPWIKGWQDFPDRRVIIAGNPSIVVPDREFLRLKFSKP